MFEPCQPLNLSNHRNQLFWLRAWSIFQARPLLMQPNISMDGKARYLDNVFIERLWRSLKYECVYLDAWEVGSQARAGIGRWITFYNHLRPHAAHGGQPPAVVYFNATQRGTTGGQVTPSSTRFRSTWMIPLLTRWSSTHRTLGWCVGKSGSIAYHARSESQSRCDIAHFP